MLGHRFERAVLVVAIVLSVTACQSNVRTATVVPPLVNARSPEPGIVSSGRFGAADVAVIRDSGIRTVVDLSNDAETPTFDEASAVRDAGLAYTNIPIGGAGDLTRANVETFDALLKSADGPVLVHCGGGNRVGAMAALRAAWIEGRDVETAVEIGRAWGLTGLEKDVRAILER